MAMPGVRRAWVCWSTLRFHRPGGQSGKSLPERDRPACGNAVSCRQAIFWRLAPCGHRFGFAGDRTYDFGLGRNHLRVGPIIGE
jgi:hypothetical protein